MCASVQRKCGVRQQLQARVSESLAGRGVSTSDLWTPKPSGQLTKDEQSRLERQRANKRKWARKERERSKKEMEELKEKKEKLEKRNCELKDEVESLTRRQNVLKRLAKSHKCINTPARSTCLPIRRGRRSARLASSSYTRTEVVKYGGAERRQALTTSSGWTTVEGSPHLVIQNGTISSQTQGTLPPGHDTLELSEILQLVDMATTQQRESSEPNAAPELHGSEATSVHSATANGIHSCHAVREQQRQRSFQILDQTSDPSLDCAQGKSFMELLGEKNTEDVVSEVMQKSAEVPTEFGDDNGEDDLESKKSKRKSDFLIQSTSNAISASLGSQGAETANARRLDVGNGHLLTACDEKRTRVYVIVLSEGKSKPVITNATGVRRNIISPRPVSSIRESTLSQEGRTCQCVSSSPACSARTAANMTPVKSATKTSVDLVTGSNELASPTTFSEQDRDSKDLLPLRKARGRHQVRTMPEHAPRDIHHTTASHHYASTNSHHAPSSPHHASTNPHHTPASPHRASTNPHHTPVSPHHASTNPHHAPIACSSRAAPRRSISLSADAACPQKNRRRPRLFSVPCDAVTSDETEIDDMLFNHDELEVDCSLIKEVLDLDVNKLPVSPDGLLDGVRDPKWSEYTVALESEFSLGDAEGAAGADQTVESSENGGSSTAVTSSLALGMSIEATTPGVRGETQDYFVGDLVDDDRIVYFF